MPTDPDVVRLSRHPAAHAAQHDAPPAQLEAVWARHADEVEAAQRLRWRVFVDEMGARLPGRTPGIDRDIFDAHCEHLVVRVRETPASPARVVGTYRVLTPAAARLIGGLYADTEFDLVRLQPLRPRMAELGRSCVDADFRSGPVIMMLWSALAAFMQRNALDLMIGCASVPMRDGGHFAASLWRRLSAGHLATPDLHVRPRLPLPVDELRSDLPAEPPPLIRGYLRCGAKLLGAPAWDPDFGTADLPMMLRMGDLPEAWRRRFTRAV